MAAAGSGNFWRLATRLSAFGFVLGGAMEAFMIKVPVGGRTFYDVAKAKKAERIFDAREEAKERQRELEELYGNK